MKYIFLILSCLSLVCLSFQHSLLTSKKPSDLELGTLGADDQLLAELSSERVPTPYFIIHNVTMSAKYEDAVYTYITAVESGLWPEARSYLQEGGPGTDGFTIRMEPGAPQGHNYTIRGYGRFLRD